MSWGRTRGHDEAAAAFRRTVDRGRLAHAYLFVGPDGVGKRLFAAELTRALLCERPPETLAACGRCASCALVDAGTHPDVFAVRTPEGKVDLPVDAMRDFCARMALKPTRGARKVGVVETADDFNDESANCFLKTLEEPPPGALLILLATGADRQLPTILSRCQVVRFSPLGEGDLRPILGRAGVTDAEHQDRLIRLSGGSAGAALALADESFWNLRQELLGGLASPRPDYPALAARWQEFYEAAGKEQIYQRPRVALVVRFLSEFVQQAVRASVGLEPEGADAAEQARVAAFAARVGADRLLDLADDCVEADLNVGRKVMLILVVELLLERFQRASVPR